MSYPETKTMRRVYIAEEENEKVQEPVPNTPRRLEGDKIFIGSGEDAHIYAEQCE